MDRVIDFRRPDSSTGQNVSTKLSKNSRLFFALNIVQVVAIGGIQTAMMQVGDFKAIDLGGMGPGRRVYMALFCFGVLYSCFLCLFAVRNENFLEIVAFVVQNFGYICYSFVQVYHTNYKTYEGLRIRKDEVLAILVIANCVVLITLNIVFTYLAYQLFIEYGWKIYKRVRFNVRLRAAFHYYELVVCLMKMTMLFVIMFAMCLNQTILREFTTSLNYIISISVVPLTLFVCVFATYGIRKENKLIVVIFLVSMVVGVALEIYEIYSVRKRTCTYCGEMYSGRTVDIPEEVILHVVYLASVAITMMVLLSLATLKTICNFGIGLKAHFQGGHTNSNILSMGFPRELVRNLFHSSVSRTDSMPDLPDNSLDDVIVNPTIVLSTPTMMSGLNRKGTIERNPITDTDSNRSYSIQRRKTWKDDANNNDNDKGLTVPTEYMKSNSLPDRIPKEQRPSVMGRISKQATNHLNNLYYRRSVSVESKHSLCGCYFWQKRQSHDSYVVSINMDDAAAISSSSIFTRYWRGRDRSDTNVSMAFRNENFNPMIGDELESMNNFAGVDGMQTEAYSDFCFSSNTTTAKTERKHFDNKKNTTKDRSRMSKYRTAARGVSDLVSDVIVEEFEDYLDLPKFDDSQSLPPMDDKDVNDEQPRVLLHYGRKAQSVETVLNIESPSRKTNPCGTESSKSLLGENSGDSQLLSSKCLGLVELVHPRNQQQQQKQEVEEERQSRITKTTQQIKENRRSSSKRIRRRSKSFSSIEDLIFISS